MGSLTWARNSYRKNKARRDANSKKYAKDHKDRINYNQRKRYAKVKAGEYAWKKKVTGHLDYFYGEERWQNDGMSH